MTESTGKLGRGLIVVNDAETGLPTAVMDGAEITAARTAAASGVCVRRWAPEGWEDRARSAFLDGYFARVEPSLLPPGGTGTTSRMGLVG